MGLISVEERLDLLEFYQSRYRKQWRWRYKAAGNHEILADSGESYERLQDAQASARRVVGSRDPVWSWPTDGHHRVSRSGQPLLVVIRRG